MNGRAVTISAILGIVLVFAASARAEIFFANLQAAQEVPANASTATGYARVVVNESAGTLSFIVVFSGLSSNQTASHIHAPAPIGTNAAVAINFGVVGGTSGTITGSNVPITPTQLSQLRQHMGYVNVHSSNFSGGEIRGQLGPKRPVDFDGDGRQDLSVLRFPNNPPPQVAPLQWYNLNSTTGFQSAGPFGDANLDYPAPGDYDGDARDDLAVYRDGATTGADSYFYVLRSSDGTFLSVRWGVRGDQPVARDYDGDGITDASVFRRGPSVGAAAYFYYRSSRNGFVQVSTQWGTTGDNITTFDTPVPADYDGDGKFDVAVYRVGLTPANTFIILRSSDGTARFAQFGNFTTDYIAPGDYDGDGKADLCAVRTGSTGSSPLVWYVLRSSDSMLTGLPFGISSDTVVQGDYDGDARTDPAIYRPGATAGASSAFWVFRSLTNTALGTPWGIRGDFAVASFDVR